MFGETETPTSIGPNRRGLWAGLAAGCLILGTAACLVSGTVDGLNFFGGRLPDSTPNFPDPPKPDPKTDDSRPAERSEPLISTRSTASATPPAAASAAPVKPRPAPADARPAAAEPPRKPVCAPSGYAAVLEPATDPIGTALARSLKASDLRTRIIELSDKGLSRQDLDRIMAGDGSSVPGRISEGTLLVAQLTVHVRQTVIDEAPMTEVAGTMDLAIVRNNCGVVAVQRHRDISAKSVNETLDDGIRGLGEIFKERIEYFVGRGRGGMAGERGEKHD
jgi:hypothetical protein